MTASAPAGQILIYRSEDGRTKLDVRLEDQTVWLSQRQLVELFGKAKGTISEHIKHIYEDGELDPGATVRRVRTVQREGERDVGERAMQCLRAAAAPLGGERCCLPIHRNRQAARRPCSPEGSAGARQEGRR